MVLYIGILGALTLVTFLIAAIVSFETSHYIIRPLRMLNNKMRDILDTALDVELVNEEESSQELTDLYEVFTSLISTKKFENNDFMFKTDAMAVIDLAEACNMFDGQNYKAAGICFNNIANIQYKNEKYMQAAENFYNAMEQALICLKQKSPIEVYSRREKVNMKDLVSPEEPSDDQRCYYEKVLAHRTF